VVFEKVHRDGREGQMKIIFLDHDGVICLQKQWGSRFSKKAKKRGDIFDQFCPKAVKILNSLLEKTEAEIVVTSTWRLHCSLEYMKELYLERGIIKAPIAFTEDLENVWDDNDWFNEYKDFERLSAGIRSKEILVWLDKNKEVDRWVAIDDLPLERLKYFVRTGSDTEGIKQSGKFDTILNILND